MKKLLITGASGFLGWYLCEAAHQAGWQVFGVSYQKAIAPVHYPIYPLDLTDFVAVREYMTELQPDAVIHAAALSQPNACQMQPEQSYQINVIAAINLAGLCADAGVPFVFTSSEQVFDGESAPYRESDRPNPLNLYGEHKALAEVGILQRHPTAAIARMPLMYGASPYAPSFLQPFVAKLKAGERLDVFVDEWRSPVSGVDAAAGILLALEQVQGIVHLGRIVHLGGKERISRAQFGERLVEQLGLPPSLLNPCQQADVPMAAPRAKDLSLESAIAFGLGYAPRSIRENLQTFL
jgi:dTDP-4-dehydrorhamnose reductase